MPTKIKRQKALRVVTNSERWAFGCQKHWFFRYDQGLSDGAAIAPLLQGSLIHRGVELWAQAGMKLSPGALDASLLEPWLEGRKHYAEERDDSTELLQSAEDIATESRGILLHYFDYYSADAEHWELLAVEPQIAREIPHPDTGRPIISPTGHGDHKKTWAYGGRLDRVMRSRASGRVWFFETKTMKETNLDKYCRKLHFDPQIRGYAWCLQKPDMISDPVMQTLAGTRIEGVVYDVIRKAVPREPTPLAVPKPTKANPNPESPGVSRAAIDTTAAIYKATLLRLGHDPDDYTDFLAKLGGSERYFHRESYTFSDHELDKFAEDAGRAVLQIREAEKTARLHPGDSGFHPRQTALCLSGGRSGCPGRFESICMEDGPMSRLAFTTRTIRHPELEGAMADPGAFKTQGIDFASKILKRKEPDDDTPPPATIDDFDTTTFNEKPRDDAGNIDTTDNDMFGPPADEG